MEYKAPAPSSTADARLSQIASAIAEPARTRMLCCLLDGHARTATELSVVAEVSPSTASVHLARLTEQRLVKRQASGKHRYFSLDGPAVARALEGLMIVAGAPREAFRPSTPSRLRVARTCYDHMAGAVAVGLHDRFQALRWLSSSSGAEGTADSAAGNDYGVTKLGAARLEALGVDLAAVRARRRRFAYACVDWSERRPHLGGALGAEMLRLALRRRWVTRDFHSRVLEVTRTGRRDLQALCGLSIPSPEA